MQRLGKAGLAAIVFVLMLLVAVPFGRATYLEYRHFADYMNQTVRQPEVPPAWETGVLSPDDCVEQTMAWGDACPGQREFCRGAMPEVMRVCLGSQDRSAYCAELGETWMSTHFGFDACNAKAEGQDDATAKTTRKFCAIGYRGIANHCRELGRQP